MKKIIRIMMVMIGITAHNNSSMELSKDRQQKDSKGWDNIFKSDQFKNDPRFMYIACQVFNEQQMLGEFERNKENELKEEKK